MTASSPFLTRMIAVIVNISSSPLRGAPAPTCSHEYAEFGRSSTIHLLDQTAGHLTRSQHSANDISARFLLQTPAFDDVPYSDPCPAPCNDRLQRAAGGLRRQPALGGGQRRPQRGPGCRPGRRAKST